MAYLYQAAPEDEEQQQNGLAGGVSTLPPSTGTGGSVIAGGTGAPGPTPTPGQTQGPSSSGWTNLRAYLDANQSQAGDIADKVSGEVAKEGDAAKGTVEKNVGDYQTNLSGYSVPNAADLATRALSNPGGLSDAEKKSVKDFQTGSYSGPQPFEATPGYGDASAAAASGSDLANQVRSEGGTRSLLKKIEPNISEGGTELNQLLLSGVPGASDRLVSSAAPYAGLRDYLSGKVSSLDATRNNQASDFKTGQGTIANNFVAPANANLKDLQDKINARVQGASTDVNKDTAIKDLESYVGGNTSALPGNEASMFFPDGFSPNGYDEGRLHEAIDQYYPLSDYGGHGDFRDTAIDRALSYVLGRQTKTGQDPSLYAGNGSGEGRGPGGWLDQLKSNVGQYSLNPITKLQATGSFGPDWMSKYFPGTARSSGSPSAASVASPEEAARILSLQDLVANAGQFLKPEDRALAGTYKPASIGVFRNQ